MRACSCDFTQRGPAPSGPDSIKAKLACAGVCKQIHSRCAVSAARRRSFTSVPAEDLPWRLIPHAAPSDPHPSSPPSSLPPIIIALKPLITVIPPFRNMASHSHLGAAADASVNIPYSTPSTPHPQHQVGWIGLGNMGVKMAANLAKHMRNMSPPLPPLLVYNRTVSKAQALEKELDGLVKAVDSVEAIGTRCDLIFTSLSDDDAAEQIYESLLQAEEKRVGKHLRNASLAASLTLLVDTSTLYPATTGKLERKISALPKRHFVAAPAFGPHPWRPPPNSSLPSPDRTTRKSSPRSSSSRPWVAKSWTSALTPNAPPASNSSATVSSFPPSRCSLKL